jgi:ubiquinone/menaquinone biosynthesis C-methylase UbiE
MPAVRFAEADVADLRFDSGSFDLAVANHLFNDLPDIVGPVGELARVLRPGTGRSGKRSAGRCQSPTTSRRA